MIRGSAVVLLVGALFVGCGGAQKVSEPADVSGDPANMDEVDAEVLAASPCGNPDWSKLPEGSDAPDPQ